MRKPKRRNRIEAFPEVTDIPDIHCNSEGHTCAIYRPEHLVVLDSGRAEKFGNLADFWAATVMMLKNSSVGGDHPALRVKSTERRLEPRATAAS